MAYIVIGTMLVCGWRPESLENCSKGLHNPGTREGRDDGERRQRLGKVAVSNTSDNESCCIRYKQQDVSGRWRDDKDNKQSLERRKLKLSHVTYLFVFAKASKKFLIASLLLTSYHRAHLYWIR